MTTSNPLGRLIDATREANAWSDEYIAGRARRAGHQMSKSTISDIRTKGLATIVPSKLAALAAGLDIPLAEITRAALETAGLPASRPGVSVEQAIQRDVTLPVAAKRALLAMLREARRTTDPPTREEIAAAEQDAKQLAEQRRLFIAASEQETAEQELFPPLLDDEEPANVEPSPLDKRRAQREAFERDQAIRRAAGHPEFQPPPGSTSVPEIDERTAADRGPKRADEEGDDFQPDPEGPEGGA